MKEVSGKLLFRRASSIISMKGNMNAFNQMMNMFYEYSSLDMSILAQ